MLEIKFLRQNFSLIQKALDARGETVDLDTFITQDNERRAILLEIEDLRHQRNSVSEKIAQMKKNHEDAASLIADMRIVSSNIKDLETSLGASENAIKTILMEIPNIPHTSVPVGQDESNNTVIKQVGTPPDFNHEPQAHWDLGEKLNIFDFARASKITGARFPMYYGLGAALERALISFMLDIHTKEHGYREVLPPFIVNQSAMTNTGQLPKFEEDLFKLQNWDYYLIPTAEVPVTNIHQDEILDADSLPIKYTAFTPCFRSEAGSYGKDTRGLIRQHQFNKVELVKFAHPDNSYDELETLLQNAERILQELKLPYQVVSLCTGDLGFSAAKTYDIEVWMPAQGVYREISSCSNFEDFQARRAHIRFKQKGHKGTRLVHTLNGSGLAVGRTFAAILENYQQADGTVIIPEVLHDYLGGIERISP